MTRLGQNWVNRSGEGCRWRGRGRNLTVIVEVGLQCGNGVEPEGARAAEGVHEDDSTLRGDVQCTVWVARVTCT